MVGVLFVCSGNICRSPLAEALFRRRLEEVGLDGKVVVDSAGTGAWHVGEPPCPGTLATLRRLGLSADGLMARQVTDDDFHTFDYILAMDRENLAILERRRKRLFGDDPQTGPVIELFLRYAPELGVLDVNDPYYNGRHDLTYRQVAAGVEGFLKHLSGEMGRLAHEA
ncbi:low molecular weight protein-tyrosine-phosphatase [Hydrogenibacillus schlegelii]|nr:low molecular weight protein-tyrosine-phosphatase [Hydrogenibacillus schlegelii]KWX06942.1 hypothetical protein TR75_04485 [Hydrogenibacillus schlegelii]